jgi:hypothetical protein
MMVGAVPSSAALMLPTRADLGNLDLNKVGPTEPGLFGRGRPYSGVNP